jgi:hypothetical protein
MADTLRVTTLGSLSYALTIRQLGLKLDLDTEESGTLNWLAEFLKSIEY